MEKKFEFQYKVYTYEDKLYSQCTISAKNRKEAFIKFVAESNCISFKEAKEVIKDEFGSGLWRTENAINAMNPLGSNDSSLYELQSINQINT